MAVPAIQTSFAAGEISPELYGEVDLKKLSVAATTLRNFIVNYKGGALSRGGTAFVGRCKQNPPYPPRPIPFQFSIDQGYILEFGDNYIRFVYRGGYILEAAIDIFLVTQANPCLLETVLLTDPFNAGDWVFVTGVEGMTELNGNTYIVTAPDGHGNFYLTDIYTGAPVDSTGFGAYVSGGTVSRIYTISTPYAAIDLPYLKFSQSADVMSLTLSNPVTGHEYPPQTLTRFAADDWTLAATDFDAVISPPATISAVRTSLPPSNGTPGTFAYQVTAVDKHGNESVGSMIVQCNGVDLEVEGGTNIVSWSTVTGSKFYNVYRSACAVGTYGVAWAVVPAGAILGFVGSAYGNRFPDTQSVVDLTQTPPTHQNPFAPGQILGVEIVDGGTGLPNTVNYTITSAGGSGFAGYPVVNGGTLGGFTITSPGFGFQPGDSIAFNGAGFASGAIEFGSTNPSNNDTITLNSVVWTFVTAITGPQQTVIGGALATTLAQLVNDLSASPLAGLTVASYTTDLTNSNLLVTYNTAGTAGNSYTLAASRATPSGATLTGGSGTGFAGTAATGNLHFGGGNPTNGQTIVLDGVTWTFVTSGAGTNQTNLGLTLPATLTQLRTDLNASANASIALATYSATATDLDIVYKTVGTVGNSYTLAGGTAGATPSAATLTGGANASATPAATLDVGPTFGTYPGVNAYFQQRHFYANSLNDPDTFWASQPGLFQNFDTAIPTIATDAITASPWTEQVNGIQWLIPMPGGLIAMTGLRAWQIIGEGSYQLNVQPITPSTTQAQPQAFNGCSPTIPPIVIDYDVIYVEAVGETTVRDLSWNFWVNIYTGADLTILSSHLFLYRKIEQWTWARLPYKVLWAACDDGTMLSLTYLKEQEVYGWARHDTQGLVVGIASVTEPPVNAVYAVVERFGPALTGPSETTYVMEALENYDPAAVAQWSANTQPNFCFQDKQCIGTSFDFGRRKIMYSGIVAVPPLDANNNILTPNTTGQTLWSGVTAIPPGNLIDQGGLGKFIFQIYEKDIDTGAVVHYDPYGPANLVPANIGAGGVTGLSITTPGTAGPHNRTVYNFPLTGGSGTGDLYANVTFNSSGAATAIVLNSIGAGYVVNDVLSIPGASSDARFTVTSVNTGSDGASWGRMVYDATLFGGDIQAIVDPRTNNLWVHIESCELYLFRFSARFTLEISPLQPTINRNSEGEPIGVTADWVYYWENFGGPVYTSVLRIVPSSITAPEITADKLLSTYDYSYPDNTYYFRQCVGPDGNLYVYGAAITGTRAYKLWNCVAGVGFTEITPWSGSTGPNTNCAAWTGDGVGLPPWTLVNTHWGKHYIIQLPATGDLVCISALSPPDAPGHTTDPTYFRVDATYFNIGGGTFDYHEGFVTGYMTAAWVSTSVGSAAWLVAGYREINNYLEASDYVYPGVDYTKRWFMFECRAMSGGVPVDTTLHSVFVEYGFVSGSAPVVLQVIAETGWDAAYPGYQISAEQSEIVAASLPNLSVGTAQSGQQAPNIDARFADNALYDSTTNAFWLSGDNPWFCDFNPAFVAREPQVNQAFNAQNSSAAGPFMRLSFANSAAASGAYIMERMDNRIWQTVEDAYAVDSGVSNPMIAPDAALFASAASGTGVTFSATGNAFSIASVGQIIRMGGGIATVTTFNNTTVVLGDWVLDATNGAAGVPYAAAGDWTIAAPVTTLNAPHLAGLEVVGLADGVPIGPITVGASGQIALPFAASNVKAGLSFLPQMQTPYLNGPQVAQGARKVIPAATIRLAGSGQFQVGTNQPDGGAQNPQQLGPAWTNMTTFDPLNPTGGQDPPPTYMSPAGRAVTQLWTGDLRGVAGGSAWVSKGQVAVQQLLPLPLEVVAVEPEYLPGDEPEAGFEQRGGPGGAPAPASGARPSEPPNGPGAWMLGRGGPRI